MKKFILLVLSALCLCGCDNVYVGDPEVEILNIIKNTHTATHIYCYRSDSGWCDECEHYSDMNFNADNIISFNMTVMPYPDVFDIGVKHYHYTVVEVI